MSPVRSGEKKTGQLRLLATAPRIYVGPGALDAFAGKWGVLQGAKRAQWIDVLAFELCAERRPDPAALRFRGGAMWTVVGLSLPELELTRRGEKLLEVLVPGDLLLTERGARVHLGDAWAPARVSRDARR